MARPPKPEGTVRTRTVRARITPAAGDALDAKRERLGLSESDAVREALRAWIKEGA
jgi:antitoxin component of RelBE/YafQ-DinJ toxin-antitoxin module